MSVRANPVTDSVNSNVTSNAPSVGPDGPVIVSPTPAAQALPEALIWPAGQGAHACMAASRCWFAGHTAQVAGSALASVCNGHATHAPASSLLALPQPHAVPGALVIPVAHAVHDAAPAGRSVSAAHGSHPVFDTFGTLCAGHSAHVPPSSYSKAPEHIGAATRHSNSSIVVRPRLSVAATWMVWGPDGCASSGTEMSIFSSGCGVAATSQWVEPVHQDGALSTGLK